MHPILEKIYDLLPIDKKQRNNGWIYFNAPCCSEFGGEREDTKGRGNIIFSEESCTYNCFNCHYKASYFVGSYMSKKFINLLKWMGVSQKEIFNLLSIIRDYNETNSNTPKDKPVIIKKREIKKIPDGYKSILKSLEEGENSYTFTEILKYINNRNPYILDWSDLMWCPKHYHFLIPCYEFGNVVGYSLRKLKDDIPNKYLHYLPQGYIYNYDNLLKDRKYEIVCEGQLDALAINGISMLSNEFTPDRLKRILPYTKDKEIILLPDRDNAGKKMIKQLLEEDLPFSVAFPNWERGIKDAEQAVKKYGRLYTIYSILSTKEQNKELIKLKSMKWFNI